MSSAHNCPVSQCARRCPTLLGYQLPALMLCGAERWRRLTFCSLCVTEGCPVCISWVCLHPLHPQRQLYARFWSIHAHVQSSHARFIRFDETFHSDSVSFLFFCFFFKSHFKITVCNNVSICFIFHLSGCSKILLILYWNHKSSAASFIKLIFFDIVLKVRLLSFMKC